VSDPEVWPILVLGAYALPLLVWQAARGVYSRHAFDRAPGRDGAMGPMDLAIGLGLWLVGTSAAASLALAIAGEAKQPGAVLARSLAVQAGMLLSLAYVLVRARMVVVGGIRGWGFAGRVGPTAGRALLTTLFLLPATLLTLSIVAWLSKQAGYEPDPIAHELLHVMLGAERPGIVIGFVISAVVIAPIVEETLFRGLVQTALLQWGIVANRWAVIIIASVLFTAIHLQLEPVALPGLFVLSLGLGYVYERTGSIWSSILVHSVFNAMNVALVFAGVVEA